MLQHNPSEGTVQAAGQNPQATKDLAQVEAEYESEVADDLYDLLVDRAYYHGYAYILKELANAARSAADAYELGGQTNRSVPLRKIEATIGYANGVALVQESKLDEDAALSTHKWCRTDERLNRIRGWDFSQPQQ